MSNETPIDKDISDEKHDRVDLNRDLDYVKSNLMKDIETHGLINEYTELTPIKIVFYEYDAVVDWLREQLKPKSTSNEERKPWIGARIGRRIKNLFRREPKKEEKPNE